MTRSSPTRRTALIAACVLALCATASQDFVPIGAFDNVRESGATGEGHCYGYSLELWSYKGHVLGLLDRHQGLCGDPPCEALTNVSHDPKTGALRFVALGASFTGTLGRNEVAGTLDGQRVRLRQRKDDLGGAQSDQTIDAWCGFWRGVSRCKGVSELCASLKVQRP